MHGWVRGAPLGIGCLLVLLAEPARAQDPQVTAGEQTDLQRRREARCASLTESERRKTDICKTDEERREDEYQARVKQREAEERQEHSSFLRWLHTDVLWIPTESGNTTYGLVGVHVAIFRLGRFDVYGPPGVMLFRQREGSRSSVLPGYTWGVSIFLTELKLPGTMRRALVFADLTKCWTWGDIQNGMSMIGFSITWKK